MEGNCFNIGDSEGKANAASTSEDIKLTMASLVEGTCNLEGEKGSEDKAPKKDVTVEGSSSDVEENIPLQNQSSPAGLPHPDGDDAAKTISVDVSNPPPMVAVEDQTSRKFSFEEEKRSDVKEATDESSSGDIEKNKSLLIQPSPVALPDAGGDSVAKPASESTLSPPPRVVEKNEKSKTLGIYPCGKCRKQFSTAQGLGGHQNIHRHEREHAKRQKMHGETPSNSSLGHPPVIYTKCVCFPYILPCGHPQLTLQNANNVMIQRPPLGQPYSMHPNTQYPFSTTSFTLGQFGQPSCMMCNSRQLSIFVRPEISNSMGHGFNSMGIVGGQERGGANQDFLTLNTNSGSLPVDGLEEETASDGTIDLLSRVGKGNGGM